MTISRPRILCLCFCLAGMAVVGVAAGRPQAPQPPSGAAEDSPGGAAAGEAAAPTRSEPGEAAPAREAGSAEAGATTPKQIAAEPPKAAAQEHAQGTGGVAPDSRDSDPRLKAATAEALAAAEDEDKEEKGKHECWSCCVPDNAECPERACRKRRRCWEPPRAADWRHYRRLPDAEGWGTAAIMAQTASLRGDTYIIEGTDVDARTYGIMVATGESVIGHYGPFAHRYDFTGALGAGGGGVQGELSMDAGGGLLGWLSDGVGPFGRFGFGLQFLGNPYVYRSRFELPTLELGLQVLTSDVLLEVAGHGGVVLVGRYNTGEEAHRNLGADVAGGGRVTFQVERFRLDAHGLRIDSHRERPGGPVDELRSQACVEPVEAFTICGNADWHRGRVILPTGESSTSTVKYFGLTLAWGGIVVY